MSHKYYEVKHMIKMVTMYHEKMFYFWYGKNSMMRDYHGKKYVQMQSIPTEFSGTSVNFRNYKQSAVVVAQSVAIVASFIAFMLALVAQFA